MTTATWFMLIGLLFIVMALISAALKRLPMTAAIVYLTIGYLLSETFLGVLSIEPLKDSSLVHLLTEIAVVISLFTAGLKLRLPLRAPEWRLPVLMASLSMMITIAVVSVAAVYGLGFSWGAAILLGAVLAPTDPVLASSVQVLGPEDRDHLRFSLTAEAGLNDGTAFPFVMLGLGLLGLHDLGVGGSRWLMVDLVWGVLGGLGIGTLLGTGISKIVAYLRARHKEVQSYDDFMALGLIGVSYGVAILLGTYGFLAVFAAGLALRQRERRESSQNRSEVLEAGTREGPVDTQTVTGLMALGVLEFNEQMERIGELVVVALLGAMLSWRYFIPSYFWMVPVVFLIARPLSVLVLPGFQFRSHRYLTSWFGIRGIGSLYYLFYAIDEGLPHEIAKPMIAITFSVIVTSIFMHGLSAGPLMVRYAKKWS